MKTLLKQIIDAIKDLLAGSSILTAIQNKQAVMDAKLDHILLNQELLAAYLGLTPGGATPEDLETLGARIKATKDQIASFDQSTTQNPV